MTVQTEVLVAKAIDAFLLLLRVQTNGRKHNGGYTKMSFIRFLLLFASVVVGQKTRKLVAGPLWNLLRKGQSHDLAQVGVKGPEDLEMLAAALKSRVALKHVFMALVGICEFVQARKRFGRPLLRKLLTKMKSCSCKSLVNFAVRRAIKGKRKGCFGVLATPAALVVAG